MQFFWHYLIYVKHCKIINNNQDISDVLEQERLRWFGHVMRKDEKDVVKRVWKGEQEGQRRHGMQW